MAANPPTKHRMHSAEACWVMGLLLLAFVLRWGPALNPHFWFDEIFTISLARQSFGDILKLTAADMHPPLYYDWIKCWELAGSRLGGPFETLAWLRLASIIPGVLACVLAWWIARRYWGPRAALWTLAAFTVSPTMAYYSVELRCYSMLHLLLLGALWGLLRATDPRAATRWPGIVIGGGCALAAFYTHSLSTLYLGMFGLIFLAVLAQDKRLRGELAWRAAAAAGVLAICCAPWLQLMFAQTASLNAETWLNWADWYELRATFFWYMPLGPLQRNILDRSWRHLVMAVMAILLLLLVVNALRSRRLGAMGGARDHRLLVWSGLLVVIPVLAAFFLSWLRIAKVFLGFRYNLIPAPFITLALLGLIFQINGRRRRTAVLSLLIAFWAACCGLLFRQRMNECDLIAQAARVRPEILLPQSRLVWNNSTVLPWLGKCRGTRRIGSIDDILEGRAKPARNETLYLLTHLALDTNYCGLLHRRSYLLREILKRQGIPRDDVPGGTWDAVWRLTPEEIPKLTATWKTAQEAIEARRNAVPGGQVLLADAELFTMHGWSTLQYGPGLMPERWTEGPHQHLTWHGPRRPGQYRLKLFFRRPHPFPEETVTIRYRLPGQREWRTQQAGLGQVIFEGEVNVRTPRERMRIHLETPTWIPSERIGESMDRRRVGMLFEALELHPM